MLRMMSFPDSGTAARAQSSHGESDSIRHFGHPDERRVPAC
jgi:hypothetical protein